MKLLGSLILFAFILTLCSSCVSRTISHQDSVVGSASRYEGTGRVTEKKIVWFFQPSFWTKK